MWHVDALGSGFRIDTSMSLVSTVYQASTSAKLELGKKSSLAPLVKDSLIVLQ
jgi:hypothetical protein